jgi:hypothetical protein
MPKKLIIVWYTGNTVFFGLKFELERILYRLWDVMNQYGMKDLCLIILSGELLKLIFFKNFYCEGNRIRWA